MTLRKIMLLASMAMAAVAFAAPAAQAEAPQWYHEGNLVGAGAGNGKELHMTGSVSNTVIGGGGFITGPCEFTFEGEAWNENGMADGAITGGAIQHICPTSVSGCTVTPTLQNFPWNLTGATITEEPGLEIVGTQLELHYIGGAACPVPVSTIMATGALTGIVEEEDHRCLTFEEHTDGMLTHAPLPTLVFDLLGTLCDTTLELG